MQIVFDSKNDHFNNKNLFFRLKTGNKKTELKSSVFSNLRIYRLDVV